ncbi:hypothetical protein [Porphyrobacter sp. HT-58-2]|uniref:hypothetical protein n=1 Tax=Porphyrobacter sp. HT-58-2 TaxID=2023229 RepID=UPI00155944AE|nr:hypothetical protein [Porphyrobacter sp. HT-58-2]
MHLAIAQKDMAPFPRIGQRSAEARRIPAELDITLRANPAPIDNGWRMGIAEYCSLAL